MPEIEISSFPWIPSEATLSFFGYGPQPGAGATSLGLLVAGAKGAVQTDVMRQWTVPAVVGIAAGSVIAFYAPGEVFKVAAGLNGAPAESYWRRRLEEGAVEIVMRRQVEEAREVRVLVDELHAAVLAAASLALVSLALLGFKSHVAVLYFLVTVAGATTIGILGASASATGLTVEVDGPDALVTATGVVLDLSTGEFTTAE